MIYKVFPTEFEIYDADMSEVVAKVKAVDETCFEVDIIGAVSKHNWQDISNAVAKALATDEGL